MVYIGALIAITTSSLRLPAHQQQHTDHCTQPRRVTGSATVFFSSLFLSNRTECTYCWREGARRKHLKEMAIVHHFRHFYRIYRQQQGAKAGLHSRYMLQPDMRICQLLFHSWPCFGHKTMRHVPWLIRACQHAFLDVYGESAASLHLCSFAAAFRHREQRRKSVSQVFYQGFAISPFILEG